MGRNGSCQSNIESAPKDPRKTDEKKWTSTGELETSANTHELEGDHERAIAELDDGESGAGMHTRSELE